MLTLDEVDDAIEVLNDTYKLSWETAEGVLTVAERVAGQEGGELTVTAREELVTALTRFPYNYTLADVETALDYRDEVLANRES